MNSPFVRLMLASALAIASSVLGAGTSPSDPDLTAGPREEVAGIKLGNAVLNAETGLSYASIQAAIAAATPGDELVVQVPTLMEGLVTIDRSIALRGATGNETVQATSDTTDSGDGRAWFLVQSGANLDVADLSFEAPGRQIYQAFRVRGTSSFRSVGFSTILFPGYQGTAVVAFGDGPITVEDCHFTDFGRVGVFLFGASVAGSVVRDSSFSGKGIGDHLDYPIELGGGASATVVGNVISNVRGVASVDNSISAGILLSTIFGAGTDGTIEGNQFLDNSFGITQGNTDDSTYRARFNRFFGNDTAVRHTSSSNPDLTLNWWGCNEGPGLDGCDEIISTAGAGTWTSEPWLTLSLALAPQVIELGEQLIATASLRLDSTAADTSGLGSVDDGIPVAFDAAPTGVAIPAAIGTSSALASTSVEGLLAEEGEVRAVLDAETVISAFSVRAADVPTLSQMCLIGFIGLLAMTGWYTLRSAH